MYVKVLVAKMAKSVCGADIFIVENYRRECVLKVSEFILD